MAKGAITFGTIIISAGLLLLILTKAHPVSLIYGPILIILGLALIIFWKEETRVEQRKDLTRVEQRKDLKKQKSKK